MTVQIKEIQTAAVHQRHLINNWKKVFLATSFVFHCSSPSVLDYLSAFPHYGHSNSLWTSASPLSLWMKMSLVEKPLPVLCDSRVSAFDCVPLPHYGYSDRVISAGPYPACHLYFWLNDTLQMWGQSRVRRLPPVNVFCTHGSVDVVSDVGLLIWIPFGYSERLMSVDKKCDLNLILFFF